MRCRVLVLTALGTGCVEVPGPYDQCRTGEDRDGDGWACDGIAADCDDGAAAINPGEEDLPGDGIDQDCLDGDVVAGDRLDGVAVEDGAIRMAGHVASFAAKGVGYPVELVEDATGIELLYDGTHRAHGIGIALAPLFYSEELPTAPEMRIVAEGPAVVAVELTWDAPDIDGTADLGGTSELRFFPDGRIVRHDVVTLSDDVGGADLDFGPYLSIDADRFSHVAWNSGNPLVLDGETDALVFQNAPDEGGWACAFDTASGRMLGFGWAGTVTGAGGRAVTGEGRLTFSFDWVRDATIALGDSWAHTTVMFVGAAGASPSCGVDTYVLGLEDDELYEAVAPSFPDSGQSDIVREGLYAVRSTGGNVEVTARIPDEGVALDAIFDADPDVGVTVWLGGRRLAAGVDYLLQMGGQTGTGLQMILFYAGPIAMDEPLRIAAPGWEP